MRQLSNNLWGMLIAAIISVAAIILVIWNFDPDISGWPIFILFFLACLIFLSAVSIMAYYFVKSRNSDISLGELMPESIRQGLIIGGALTILLILQSIHVLTWINGLSIIIIAVILSMYFKQ